MPSAAPPNAPAVVTEKHITEFRESGFTHIRALLTDDEAAHYGQAARQAIEEEGRRAGMGGGGTGVEQTDDAYWKHPVLRTLARHPRIGRLAEQLAGIPLRVFGGEAFAKPPGDTSPTIWHDDLTFAPLDARLTLNIWIALADVPAERGCMTFVPGSHHRPDPYRVELSAAVREPHAYLFTEWPWLRFAPRVAVPLRRGDATVHQWRVAHSAAPNASDDTRLAFITTYADAEAIYQPHPGYNPARLQEGERLPDDRCPRVSDLT
ncbi:MAG TPA: phytanoyl-CoA dioxygenase family protein [Nonomuraea sp.]|nr:phytanoyl-CoA dioxygenase family protein [Nonomuraea sp.]